MTFSFGFVHVAMSCDIVGACRSTIRGAGFANTAVCVVPLGRGGGCVRVGVGVGVRGNSPCSLLSRKGRSVVCDGSAWRGSIRPVVILLAWHV